MVKRKNSNKVMRGGEYNKTNDYLVAGAVFSFIVAIICLLAAANVF